MLNGRLTSEDLEQQVALHDEATNNGYEILLRRNNLKLLADQNLTTITRDSGIRFAVLSIKGKKE